LLDPADKDGGGVHPGDVDGLIGGEQGHAGGGELPGVVRAGLGFSAPPP
jgi:hypothetical protein